MQVSNIYSNESKSSVDDYGMIKNHYDESNVSITNASKNNIENHSELNQSNLYMNSNCYDSENKQSQLQTLVSQCLDLQQQLETKKHEESELQSAIQIAQKMLNNYKSILHREKVEESIRNAQLATAIRFRREEKQTYKKLLHEIASLRSNLIEMEDAHKHWQEIVQHQSNDKTLQLYEYQLSQFEEWVINTDDTILTLLGNYDDINEDITEYEMNLDVHEPIARVEAELLCIQKEKSSFIEQHAIIEHRLKFSQAKHNALQLELLQLERNQENMALSLSYLQDEADTWQQKVFEAEQKLQNVNR